MHFAPLRGLAAVCAAVALTGCASIVGSATQTVPISSNPSEANVSIKDELGVEVFSGQTPASVTLNKSTGHYWGGKTFNVTISKAGYQTQVIPVKASPNGWYIAGNFFFGGLIGWFVVDPMGGGMYSLSPDVVQAGLASTAAHNNSATDGSIRIVLLEDVPASMRDRLVRVN